MILGYYMNCAVFKWKSELCKSIQWRRTKIIAISTPKQTTIKSKGLNSRYIRLKNRNPEAIILILSVSRKFGSISFYFCSMFCWNSILFFHDWVHRRQVHSFLPKSAASLKLQNFPEHTHRCRSNNASEKTPNSKPACGGGGESGASQTGSASVSAAGNCIDTRRARRGPPKNSASKFFAARKISARVVLLRWVDKRRARQKPKCESDAALGQAEGAWGRSVTAAEFRTPFWVVGTRSLATPLSALRRVSLSLSHSLCLPHACECILKCVFFFISPVVQRTRLITFGARTGLRARLWSISLSLAYNLPQCSSFALPQSRRRTPESVCQTARRARSTRKPFVHLRPKFRTPPPKPLGARHRTRSALHSPRSPPSGKIRVWIFFPEHVLQLA